MNKLAQLAGNTPIEPEYIKRIIMSRNEKDASDVLKDFAKKNSNETRYGIYFIIDQLKSLHEIDVYLNLIL